MVCVHGQAKVRYLQSAVSREERVLKFDVTVDDSQGVHVGEALHKWGHDAGDGVSLLHAASHVPQQVKQVALGSVLYDEDDMVRILKGTELQQPGPLLFSAALEGIPGMTTAMFTSALLECRAKSTTSGGLPCC